MFTLKSQNVSSVSFISTNHPWFVWVSKFFFRDKLTKINECCFFDLFLFGYGWVPYHLWANRIWGHVLALAGLRSTAGSSETWSPAVGWEVNKRQRYQHCKSRGCRILEHSSLYHSISQRYCNYDYNYKLQEYICHCLCLSSYTLFLTFPMNSWNDVFM